MSTISSVGRIAYTYSQADDTWYPVAGSTNTSADFSWTGVHSFSQSAQFSANIKSLSGLNNFQNATLRAAAIPSPTNGNISFLREDDLGLPINQVQYYYNGAWRPYGDQAWLSRKINNYEIVLSDAGRTIEMENANANSITIPLAATVPFPVGTIIKIIQSGAGKTSIIGAGGVTILSKVSPALPRTSAQYTYATIIKRDTNTWYAFGDIIAV